jgi:hypothetical protein
VRLQVNMKQRLQRTNTEYFQLLVHTLNMNIIEIHEDFSKMKHTDRKILPPNYAFIYALCGKKSYKGRVN